MDYSRILIIRFHLIGDVLLVTPLIQNLRRQFPKSRIVLLTDDPAGSLIKGHPAVDEVVIYNKEFGAQKLTFRDLFRHIQILRMVRRERFDLAINLQPGFRSEMATEVSRAQTRVGYARTGMRKSCYTHTVLKQWSGEYRVKDILATLEAIGICAEMEMPRLGLSEADRVPVRSYLESDPRPLVVIHPGRDGTNKAWIEERFVELGRSLVDVYEARLAFLGDASEAVKAERIISEIGGSSESFAGKLSLREVGALIEGAQLFIGIDSSPLHIASAVGTPTIGLFGPSDAKIWNPPGEKHVVICKEPVEAHECGDPHCDCGECLRMKNIFVEDILPAVDRFIPRLCKIE